MHSLSLLTTHYSLLATYSIFTGDKLLTTANPEFDEDTKMFDQLGLKGAYLSKEVVSSKMFDQLGLK